MIEDLRKIVASRTAWETDIAIIGCGPVGISLAEALESTGRDILVIEGGGVKPDAESQALNEACVIGLPHTGHRNGRARAVGGTGHLWAGQCLRLDTIDLEPRAWVPHSGWPFDGDELSPYYARAEQFFALPDADYGERNYTLAGITPPHWSGAGLVNHFTLYTPEIDTALHHLDRLRNARNITVLTNAHAVGIETSGSGNAVRSAHLRTLDGGEARVRASTIVLAAGGIENARILLSSTQRDADGIGNANGLVGRFFQEHPNAITAALEPTDAADLQDRFRLFYHGAIRKFPKFALNPELQRAHGVLNCNAHIVFEYPEDSGLNALRRVVHAVRRRRLPQVPLREMGAIMRDADQVVRAVVRRVAMGRSPLAAPTAIRLQCYLEQAPNPDSRIYLSSDVDRLGMRRLCIDWRLTELEHETLTVMTRVAAREFASAGVGQLRPEPWLLDGGDGWRSQLRDCSHHIGTTRMAASARDGVVNSQCQVFGVDGLFVAGSSVFPTSGYANPTLTAVALALRLADTLKRRLARPHATATENLATVTR